MLDDVLDQRRQLFFRAIAPQKVLEHRLAWLSLLPLFLLDAFLDGGDPVRTLLCSTFRERLGVAHISLFKNLPALAGLVQFLSSYFLHALSVHKRRAVPLEHVCFVQLVRTGRRLQCIHLLRQVLAAAKGHSEPDESALLSF